MRGAAGPAQPHLGNLVLAYAAPEAPRDSFDFSDTDILSGSHASSQEETHLTSPRTASRAPIAELLRGEGPTHPGSLQLDFDLRHYRSV
jgi:hypothetical protein